MSDHKIRYVPAPKQSHIHSDPHPNVGKVDDNSCIEGSILGGIAGGGLGAALSRKEGRLSGQFRQASSVVPW